MIRGVSVDRCDRPGLKHIDHGRGVGIWEIGEYNTGRGVREAMIGKVPPDDLAAEVFSRTGDADPAVTLGPAYGEDAAAIELGEQYLVVSSDPISLAAARVGTLGVHVACNDIAVTGARPRWLTCVIFLPESGAKLDAITSQLDQAVREIDVSIVGGHTEYAPARDRPLLCLTAFGVTDRVLPTGGAAPGDRVILTKGAGIEGTAILASDFGSDLDVSAEVLAGGEAFFDDISVIAEAEIVGESATAMHDPTEGGVIDGLLEVAVASDVAIEVERAAVPIRTETAMLCEAVDVDPLRIFGSGGLLATVPPGAVETVLSTVEAAGIEAAEIGQVTQASTPHVVLDGEEIAEPLRDALYALWR